MAFRRLFPSLPPEAQSEWQSVKSTGSRQEATQWLMQRMRKHNGKWVFFLSPEGGLVSKERKQQDLQGMEEQGRAVPRFRAIAMAGGLENFQRALASGEIKEVKSKRSGKSLFHWEEERTWKGTESVAHTTLQQSCQAESNVFDDLWMGLDFVSLAGSDPTARPMGSNSFGTVGMGHPGPYSQPTNPMLGGGGGPAATLGGNVMGGMGNAGAPSAIADVGMVMMTEELPPHYWSKLDEANGFRFFFKVSHCFHSWKLSDPLT